MSQSPQKAKSTAAILGSVIAMILLGAVALGAIWLMLFIGSAIIQMVS